MSGLILIQTVWHSDGIFMKEFFKKEDFEKSQHMTKRMKNYPARKELNRQL